MLSLAFRAVVLLLLALAAACGRPRGVPEASPGNTQKLPFDRKPGAGGISPSQSLLPATSHLPEGTAVTIRLRNPLSSASAHSGEGFDGALDEPVLVDDQTLIASGAAVTGRVLDAQPSSAGKGPGYLRIALVSVNADGKAVLIETSSIFAKARADSHGTTSAPGANGVPKQVGSQKDIVLSTERRLTFRLTQAVDLP